MFMLWWKKGSGREHGINTLLEIKKTSTEAPNDFCFDRIYVKFSLFTHATLGGAKMESFHHEPLMVNILALY